MRPVPPAPCRDRQGWCTDWLARSGRLKFAEGREKGGRREEEGRQEQGREREEEGGREERGTFLWSLGSRGVPLGLAFWAWDDVLLNRFRITCVAYRFFGDFLKSLGETKWKWIGFPI